MDREQLKEAREVAEEELAFLKDTGKNVPIFNGRQFYKQQLKLLDHIEELERRIEELREVVEFYAEWWPEGVAHDGGEKARKALG